MLFPNLILPLRCFPTLDGAGPISLLDFLQPRPGPGSPPSGPRPTAAVPGALAASRLSCWVLPRQRAGPPGGAAAAPTALGGTSAGAGGWQTDPEGEAWREALLRRLLRYPRPEFARRGASARAWAAGVARAWEAVAKSPDVLDLYSRLQRTALKGAGGWGLAR